VNFSIDQLIARVMALGKPKILVIGDLILDRYIFGTVERISPEAPVPILKRSRVLDRRGGAFAVRDMCEALGADARIKATRSPTIKTRYLTEDGLHLLRVDDDDISEPNSPEDNEHCEDQAVWTIESLKPDAILISDYGKGVCTPRLLRLVIDAARANHIPVIVDPARGVHWKRYNGATIIKPNHAEWKEMADQKHGPGLGKFDWLIGTLGQEGIFGHPMEGRSKEGEFNFPATRRQVIDPTGAGDMVLAVLGLALASGATPPEAAALANHAAGMQVERFGATPIFRKELLADLFSARDRAGEQKRCGDHFNLVAEVQARQAAGQTVVFTNGCFDVFHRGHAELLEAASGLGDFLIVAVNTDESVQRLKGDGRPVNTTIDRLKLLRALPSVDRAIAFIEDTPYETIKRLGPDVLVRGTNSLDSGEVPVGADLVSKVVLVPISGNISSTSIIDKIRRSACYPSV
jgi:D-beta-D-heptose 7-phosphate kinase/D-beta-D-heptose 1-phosphate adenosyltransferase